ncbi:ATP-dependent DNA helicase PIF1 [Folsomia candida]|uniref:ATP-dependent DNA helicase n=1 Tax=Folsomia candida TaxID=158441 RepID=A0A226E4I6_FOLCA|nr:ATP-dependent DNA helicase PIF1 [Folsomia candida]
MEKVSRLLLSRRTVGSQEAAYRMANLPMRHTSRAFVYIPTYLPGDRIRLLKKNAYLERDEVQFASKIIDKYCNRPEDLRNICLFEFASKYQPVRNYQQVDDDFDEGEEQEHQLLHANRLMPRSFYLKDRSMGLWRERAKYAVIKSPPFHSDSDAENFIYSHLLLYVPFIEENFTADGESVTDAFEKNKANIRTTLDFPLIRPDIEKDLEAVALHLADLNQDPQETLAIHEVEEYQYLPDVYDGSNVLPAQEEYRIVLLNEACFMAEKLKMNQDQKFIYDMIEGHLCDPSRGQLQLFISGAGGTGKSFLISLMTNLICAKEDGPGPAGVLLAAPTGVAALNINGQTLHRTFQLAVESGSVPRYAPLGAIMLQRMRDKFRDVEWIIMDEVSMISYELFRQVSQRLGECFDNTLPFGGKNVIVVGDLFQLEPVNGHCIYDQPRQLGAEENLWKNFAFKELTVNMRQGQDPLLYICNNLREGNITTTDLHELRMREFSEDTSSTAMKDKFKDAIRIFPTRNQASIYNRLKTRTFRSDPHIKVYTIKARDSFFSGTKAGSRAPLAYSHRDSNKCGGFVSSIDLAVGSRIMVIRNSPTNRYLVNGSMGTVVGFKWEELAREQHHHGDLPSSVLVKFDDWRIAGTREVGVAFRSGLNEQNVVSSRPGRPPKRTSVPLVPISQHGGQFLSMKKHRLENGDYDYPHHHGHHNPADLMSLEKSPLLANGYNHPPTQLPPMHLLPSLAGQSAAALAAHAALFSPSGLPMPPGHHPRDGRSGPMQTLDAVAARNATWETCRSAYEDFVKQFESRYQEDCSDSEKSSPRSPTHEAGSGEGLIRNGNAGGSPVLNLSKNMPEDVSDSDENAADGDYDSDNEPPNGNGVSSDTGLYDYGERSHSRKSSQPNELKSPSEESGPPHHQQHHHHHHDPLNASPFTEVSAAEAAISSTENLLRNIQGLLKVAAENAKQQERRISLEKAEFKMEIMRERELRVQLEKQLVDERNLRTYFERRWKKERRMRKRLEGDQCSSMSRSTESHSPYSQNQHNNSHQQQVSPLMSSRGGGGEHRHEKADQQQSSGGGDKCPPASDPSGGGKSTPCTNGSTSLKGESSDR